MPSATTVLIGLHLAAAMVLASYGLHRLLLAVRYVRRVRGRQTVPAREPDFLPSVTVQIPLYNERYVAERAILASGKLDYPKDLLEVQVLDDSTDDTSQAVARAVSQLRAKGVQAVHLRRTSRVGYKAGALAAGTEQARGEFLAIFDADFVPTPDFLRRVVGEFRDPTVGMVQARWGHLNAESSLLTRAQALQLDAHFTVEHGVRAAAGWFFNFNGTAGVWRRQAIESAGGWHTDTLTEDLDLSYRAQLAGWRFVYRDDLEVPAELPVEVAAYRTQQQRWAQGGIQTACKILPTLARAQIPTSIRREAFWHLTAHFTYPAMVLLAMVGLAAGWVLGPLHRSWLLAADGALLTFALAALTVFYGVAAWVRGGPRWWRRLATVPVILVLGVGIALGQAAAVYRGLTRKSTPFLRTPKYRLGQEGDGSWRLTPYRLAASKKALAECTVGLTVLAVAAHVLLSYGTSPTGSALVFGLGFTAVGVAALVQRRPGARTTAPRSGRRSRLALTHSRE
ncbi:MAG: glycosyltransferase [Gemmatimonadales bacterium]|nr:glycosyltransferase [Gemmatimonadales bacterium]NIS66599.1 glycosyltransferase [Gemmatimonadales bacterium]